MDYVDWFVVYGLLLEFISCVVLVYWFLLLIFYFVFRCDFDLLGVVGILLGVIVVDVL